MMVDKRLLNLCSDSKKYIFLTVLMNWIAIVCNIAIVMIIGKTLDYIRLGAEVPVYKYSLIVIALLAIRFMSNIFYGKFSYLSSAKAKYLLRENIYKKLLNLGSKYKDSSSTSSIVQVAVDGVEALEVYFGRYLPQLFYSLLAPLTLFIVLSFISFKAAIVLMICVPLIPISIIAIMRIAKKILKNYWNVYVNLGDTFLENIQGLTTLKVFGGDDSKHKKMNEDAERFRKITMKVLSMQLNSINIMDVIAFGGAAIGSIVALLEFKNGNISVGSVVVIILLSSEFFIPLRLLGSFFHVAMNGIAASDKIFKFLDIEEEKIEDLMNEEDLNLKDLSIELKNVSFSYDKERTILNNINLNIKNKSFVALVGESGSGKSTIASLIFKESNDYKGEIKINGLELRKIPFENIAEKISLISTNSYIFNGTILDNLMVGKKDATDKDIEKALKDAKLYDFTKGLPEGLNTKVGEGGNLLSGGQRQRLALARSLLSDREVIIFDEATSNIDVESEEQIWQTIYDLKGEKTIFVISHRLANVKDADKIYVLNKGNIVEEGSHEALYKNKGAYRSMLFKQEELEKVVC